MTLPDRVLVHEGPVLSVAFSPDGNRVLTGAMTARLVSGTPKAASSSVVPCGTLLP